MVIKFRLPAIATTIALLRPPPPADENLLSHSTTNTQKRHWPLVGWRARLNEGGLFGERAGERRSQFERIQKLPAEHVQIRRAQHELVSTPNRNHFQLGA